MRNPTRRAVLAGAALAPGAPLLARAAPGLDPILAGLPALQSLRLEVAEARTLAITLEQACFAGRDRLTYRPDQAERQEWDRAENALNEALNAMEEREDELVELTPIGPVGAMALLGLVAERIERRHGCYSDDELAADVAAIRRAQAVLASAIAKGSAI